jgi:predicted RNA-binding Zn-ribbon protein involved in translation (DUF1610 family)
MRLSEILREEEERCVTCDGTGKELVGDDQLVFDCPDCKKEDLEEIKVTKTLAGKRKRPSETLAGKLNKKKKNAGAPAVSLKTRDAHELANITLKGEYTS